MDAFVAVLENLALESSQLGVQVMRVFFYVSIVRIIGAPQSGPPRPLAAAVFWPIYCANNVAAPKSLYWRILLVYVMRVIQ